MPAPISAPDLKAFFDAVDHHLNAVACDNTLVFTERYFTRHHPRVAFELVRQWLAQHGAGCDCEVIYNTESYYLDTVEQPPAPITRAPKAKKKPPAVRLDRVDTAFGFHLDTLPSPWIARQQGSLILLTRGKRRDRCAIMIESDVLPDVSDRDESFWRRFVIERHEPFEDEPLSISSSTTTVGTHPIPTIVARAPYCDEMWVLISPSPQARWAMTTRTQEHHVRDAREQITVLLKRATLTLSNENR